MRVGSGRSPLICANTGANFGITNVDMKPDRERDGDHHDDGISHRALDAVVHLLFLREVLGQALKRFVERAGRLADAHDAHVQRGEDLRMTREARREIAPALEAFENVLERLAQDRVVRRGDQAAQAAQQRNARARDRVHLAREHHEVGGGDAAQAEPAAELLEVDAAGDRAQRLDLQRNHARGDEPLRHLVDGIAGGAAVHQLAVARACPCS